MSRTNKKPRRTCAWCGAKVREGKAIKQRGKYYCDISCGGDHPRGVKPFKYGKYGECKTAVFLDELKRRRKPEAK